MERRQDQDSTRAIQPWPILETNQLHRNRLDLTYDCYSLLPARQPRHGAEHVSQVKVLHGSSLTLYLGTTQLQLLRSSSFSQRVGGTYMHGKSMLDLGLTTI